MRALAAALMAGLLMICLTSNLSGSAAERSWVFEICDQKSTTALQRPEFQTSMEPGSPGAVTMVVNEGDSIRSAIDSIEGEQGRYTIIVTPGIYRECLTLTRGNVTLISRPAREARIVAPDSSNEKPVYIHGSPGHIISDVVFEGFCIDGNKDGQSEGRYHHGITVDYAEDVHITNNYITNTHPYHEHDSGGSGITVYPNTGWIYIRDNEVENIGDRCIQVCGENIFIENNYLHDGFDRGISWDVEYESDGDWRLARNVMIRNNRIINLESGSAIKGRGSLASVDHVENIGIVGNTLINCERGGIGLGFVGNWTGPLSGLDGNFLVKDNYIESCGTDPSGGGGIYIHQGSSIEKRIVLDNNTIAIGVAKDPAIMIDSSLESGPLHCLITDNRIVSEFGAGTALKLANAENVIANGNSFYGLFESLADMSGAKRCEVSNTYVEHAQNSITLYSSAENCIISGNYFDRLDADAIKGRGSMVRCTLENNFCADGRPVLSLTGAQGTQYPASSQSITTDRTNASLCAYAVQRDPIRTLSSTR